MRVSCRIPSDVSESVERIRIANDWSKAKALQFIVEYALEHPDHLIRKFEGPDEVNCTVDIDGEFAERCRRYRMHHMLVAKVAFLRDALLRGASYYLDNEQIEGSSSDAKP